MPSKRSDPPDSPNTASPAKSADGKNSQQQETIRGNDLPDQIRAADEELQTLASEIEQQSGLEKNEAAGEDRQEGGSSTTELARKPFPIIGIGASAGGLEALEEFFSKVPQEIDMCFVVISHTDPGHTSMLPQILQRGTRLSVVEIEDEMPIRPNSIFLPPSNRDLVIGEGTFFLKEQERPTTLRLPIDRFLRSLAESRKEQAACVILSGTGTDGTQGLRYIKEKGGMVMVQTPKTASYEGMPHSAIATGLADFIAKPGEMCEQIQEYFSRVSRHKAAEVPGESGDLPTAMAKIIKVLGTRIGHDFSLYKKSTLVRRIQRRMSIVRTAGGDGYLQYLYRHPEEIEALFQDLLIGVTGFFRDAQAFDYLQKEVLLDLLSRRPAEQPFRVWIPGCATGEEVYTVLILLHESLQQLGIKSELQVFGTDIDASSIEQAREGSYPQNIAADVSAERLNRFFRKHNSRYVVRKEIRENVVFAVQNVLKDPPFSKLDLLVCRNLLIYLEREAQKKLLPLFHYSLRSRGALFLGSSESIGEFTDLFAPLNKKWNIYRKRDVSLGLQRIVDFPTGGRGIEVAIEQLQTGKHAIEAGEVTLGKAVENLLLRRHTPACVVVNSKGEVRYIHGRTGKYLELAAGHAAFNALDMAREGLRFELAWALRKAVKTGESVLRQNLRVKTNGDYQSFNLLVSPLGQPESLKDMIVIVFEELPVPAEETPPATLCTESDAAERVIELEREVAKTQQDHRTALEEIETSNEELKSLNEELQSANEELQSSNEELESSREELQSLNEELTTVNSELHDKINELEKAYEAITDVLNSTHIAIVILDTHLNVKRFTQEATRIINLIDNDIDRPLEHISTKLQEDTLVADARQVLRELIPLEKDMQTRDSQWYSVRITPYRTKQNQIDGVILTFLDIAAQKSLERIGRKDL